MNFKNGVGIDSATKIRKKELQIQILVKSTRFNSYFGAGRITLFTFYYTLIMLI